MKRRQFLSTLGVLGFSGMASGAARNFSVGDILGGRTPDLGSTGELRPFHVTLPQKIEVLPFGSERADSRPAFPIRGLKGWAWFPEEYLSEIPVMARYRLNFLTNCYSSLWELGPRGSLAGEKPINFWYRPLSQEKKIGFEKMIRACQQHGIAFCFSVNPNLRSDRAFDYERAEDMNALWQHYAWSQKLGVKWFNFSLDDISTGIDASGQARAVNSLLQRLRAQDPEARLTFCPTWYSGTGESGVETNTTLGATADGPGSSGETPGVRYTKTLARELHPDVYLVWTGPEVCSMTITAEHARRYKALSGHRLLIFDNYPVNDQNPALHLGPFTGRSADLSSVIDGYFLNSMSYQVQANRIPLLTLADYLWNPSEYDPARSIGQAIAHLADNTAQKEALRDLVELYPGRLWDGSDSVAWNSLRERFDASLKGRDKDGARKLLAAAQTTLKRMQNSFPDHWSSGADVLDEDVKAMTHKIAAV